MGMCVCAGASLMCSFGMTPSILNVLPTNRVMAGMPVATIMDYQPMVNIMPFGLCSSMANPTVASATAAALGVLTPMPCIPLILAPWAPGSPTVLIGNYPALHQNCKLMCAYGGVIQVQMPGQTTVFVP